MPDFCASLAKTPLGVLVCNRGCGVTFPPAVIDDKVLFSCCPFGAMVGCTAVSSIDAEMPMFLVGGRFFESYHHLRLFLGNAARAGASLDDFLDSCATLVYRSTDEVEKLIQKDAENLKGWTSAGAKFLPHSAETPAGAISSEHLEAHQVELLRQFGYSLMEAENIGCLGGILLQEVSAFTHAHTVSLFLLDSERNELVMTNALGLPKNVEPGLRRTAREGVLGRVCSMARPLVVQNIVTSTELTPSQYSHYSSNSFASFPLCAGHQTLGILNVTDREIEKDFTPDEINWISLLAHSAAMAVNQKMMAHQLQKMQYLSLIDPETRTGSRSFFNTRLKEEFHRSARRNYSFCLALVQVQTSRDRFPASAEEQAHEMRWAANILKGLLRGFDVLTRYQSNVFAILLPETTRGAAEIVLHRLETTLNDDLLTHETGTEDPVDMQFSFGLAEYPNDASTIADLKGVAAQGLSSPPKDLGETSSYNDPLHVACPSDDAEASAL